MIRTYPCFHCGTATADDRFCEGCRCFICMRCERLRPYGAKHSPMSHIAIMANALSELEYGNPTGEGPTAQEIYDSISVAQLEEAVDLINKLSPLYFSPAMRKDFEMVKAQFLYAISVKEGK